MRREYNDRVWLAWHIEAFARSKRLPRLKEMMLTDSKPRRMTPEQLEATVRAWLSKPIKGR